MRKLSLPSGLLCLGAALLLGPVPLQSQPSPERDHLVRLVENNPVGRLLRHASEIGLSQEQVRRLNAIQEQIRRRSEPYVDSILRFGRAAPPPTEPGLAAGRGDERRLRMALRDVVREGIAEGWAVLTPEQQARGRAILQGGSAAGGTRSPDAPAAGPSPPNAPPPAPATPAAGRGGRSQP